MFLHRFLMALCAVTIVGVLAAEAALLETGDFSVVERSRIYYGDPASFRRPADLVLADVFRHIKPYRRIIDEDIPSDDPQYWILLRRANEIFYDGVRRVARGDGYDLVAEQGSVRIGQAIPGIGPRVIEEVRDRE